MSCTICIPHGATCATHRTPKFARWERRADDVRDLRADLRDGLIDFTAFEMAS